MKTDVLNMDQGCDPILVALPGVADAVLPSPELLMYYRNLEERTLWLDTEVTVEWLEYERQIIQWNREDKDIPVEQRKPIRLMFFTNGGDLEVNNSFVELIMMSKTPVIGINMGRADSAGCFIFMACHKRYAMPGSQFLLHQGSTMGMNGTYGQVNAYMRDYTRKMEMLRKYILAHSKISEEVLDERLKGEWFVDAREALELGVCDKIVDSIDDLI